jgi:hypothetical protein
MVNKVMSISLRVYRIIVLVNRFYHAINLIRCLIFGAHLCTLNVSADLCCCKELADNL